MMFMFGGSCLRSSNCLYCNTGNIKKLNCYENDVTFFFLSAFAPTRTRGPFVFLSFLQEIAEHFRASLAFCTFLRIYCIFMGVLG